MRLVALRVVYSSLVIEVKIVKKSASKVWMRVTWLLAIAMPSMCLPLIPAGLIPRIRSLGWHIIKLDFLGKYQEALTPQSFSIFNILPNQDRLWSALAESLGVNKIQVFQSFSFLTL
jgi:hypothetical protein